MNGSRARLAFLLLVLSVSLIAGVRSPARTAPAESGGACAGERAGALDFWVGQWRVVDAGGRELGTNKIEKLLDRTTLAPLPGGRVRQTIEISRDGGQAWTPAFDAFYVRMP
jgi:hypothetical protein